MKTRSVNNFQLELEWESLDWPIEFSHLKFLNKNYKIPQDAGIKIFRNDEYDLEGTISGIAKSQEDLEYTINGKKPTAGHILRGDIVTGNDAILNQEYKIEHFILRSTSFNFSGTPSNVKIQFNSPISISNFEEAYTNERRDIGSILEFHLTGKMDQLLPRSTDRSKEAKYGKGRHEIDPKIDTPNLISSKTRGTTRDYFYVKTSEFDFIVQRVDASLLPNWANGVQIEYRESFKDIPDEETRKAVSEIVGFVLGTQFLKVGESHLDASFNIVKKIANNPWGDNVVSKCKSPATPPISFTDHDDWNKIERVLNKLVPKYLLHRSEFGLSDAIWKYWISNELAIGTNLPILSSALEGLAENYLKAKSLITKHSKTEKKKYRDLVQDEVDILTEKLSAYDFSKRVIDKVENPFNLGIGEKLKIFYEDIGIDIGNDSIENEAMRARNKMTHSKIGSSDKEVKKYLKLTRAYQTFVNRIILKVLDFDEPYIDYYTDGHPEKGINENI